MSCKWLVGDTWTWLNGTHDETCHTPAYTCVITQNKNDVSADAANVDVTVVKAFSFTVEPTLLHRCPLAQSAAHSTATLRP